MNTLPPAAAEPVGEPQRYVRVERQLTRPRVAYVLLGITILVYLLQEMTGRGIGREPFLALGRWIMDPQLWQDILLESGGGDLPLLLGAKFSVLIDMGQWWRLLTPVLLHASLMHIGFNMYALYSLGPALEANYGHGRFLALYLLAALGGNVLSYVMTPNPSVGASTAIFGLVAAEGIFIFQNRKLFGGQANSMLANLLFIIVLNLTFGLSSRNIDNWGHLGGLAAGLVFAWFAGPKLDIRQNETGTLVAFDRRSATAIWASGIALAVLLIAAALWRSGQTLP